MKPMKTNTPLFSEDEREIISLIGLGLEDRVIAHFQKISEEALSKKLKRIYSRLHTQERGRLVIYAWRATLERKASAPPPQQFRGN